MGMGQYIGTIAVGMRSFQLIVTRDLPGDFGIHIDLTAGTITIQPRCRVRTLADALRAISDTSRQSLIGAAGPSAR